MRQQQRLALSASPLLEPPVEELRPALPDGGEYFLRGASTLASAFAGQSIINESQPPIAMETSEVTETTPSDTHRGYASTSTPLPGGRPVVDRARSLAPGSMRDVMPGVTAESVQGGRRVQHYKGIHHSIFLKVND